MQYDSEPAGAGIGSLLQLASRGPQDVYLHIKPEFSYFKKVFKRYVPFAMETIDEEFMTPPLNLGVRSRMTIPRKGDFLGEMYIKFTLPDVYGGDTISGLCWWSDSVAYKLIKSIKLYFNEHLIHEQDKFVYDMYDHLLSDFATFATHSEMIGRGIKLTADKEYTMYIPLRFFFTGKISSMLQRLPLLSMFNTKVDIDVTLEDVKLTDLLVNMPTTGNVYQTAASASLGNVKLLLNYYYVGDVDNNVLKDSSPAMMLIEQTQTTQFQNYVVGSDSTTTFKFGVNIPIPFTRPVKQMAWVIQAESSLSNVATSLSYMDSLDTASLNFFGQKKIEAGDVYYRVLQPYFYGPRCPSIPIWSYNFGFNAASPKPSGQFNLSMTTDKTLRLDYSSANIATQTRLYATSYNIVNVGGGYASLQYLA